MSGAPPIPRTTKNAPPGIIRTGRLVFSDYSYFAIKNVQMQGAPQEEVRGVAALR